MRDGSCPRASRTRARRFAPAFLAAFAGTVLFGLLPTAAMAAGPNDMRGSMGGAMGAMHATGTLLADTSTPQVSMSPHAPTEVEAGPELRKILESLICRCGCGLTVYACEGTMTCEVSVQMRKDAERMLASGMTPDQVLDAFAADYGEQVLAAPTKRGFNLTAWILPFVVLGIGGIVVVFALRSWRPQAATAGGAEEAAPPAVDPKYLAEIEKELREEE